MLGLNSMTNSWKLHVANFLIMFGVQFAFKFDEIINTGNLPTQFEVIKIVSNSVVITLIFYGYNKVTSKEKTP